MAIAKNFILYTCIFIVGFLSGIFYDISNESTNNISTTQPTYKIGTITESTEQTVEYENIVREEEKMPIEVTKKVVIEQSKKIEVDNPSPYENYVNYLNKKEFQNALDIYQSGVTNENIKMYQNYLFKFVENMLIQKDSNSLTLINMFVEIEYNNTKALYLQSKILFQNGYFQKSILTLRQLKNFYLETQFEDKVNYTLNEFSTFYIQKLQKNQEHEKLIKFLNTLLNQDSNNPKYIFMLAKLYFDLNSLDKAKELLQQISYDETYKNQVQQLLTLINKKIELSQKFSQTIALEKVGTHFLIKAVLNEEVAVKLLLDTGASMTVINDSIINKIEHTITNDKIRMNTAGGIVSAKIVRIDSFLMEEVLSTNIEVISSPLKDNIFDGLLGMSFLKQFDFYIDQENSTLYLNPK